jgi:pilus assembly protein Flp/PilA
MRARLRTILCGFDVCLGVTSIEYALIASLIAIAIIIAVTAMGLSVSNIYSAVADALS